MKRFIIKHEIPGASELTKAQLVGFAQKSNATAQSQGVPCRWMTTHVAGDTIYSLHEAEDAEAIREHSRRGVIPANVIAQIATEFGPHTAESAASGNRDGAQ